MASRVLAFLDAKERRHRFWSVGEIKSALGLKKTTHLSLGSTLYALTRAGKLQRKDDVGPRGGFGYRALPKSWPSEQTLKKEILDFITGKNSHSVTELSLLISGIYTEPPCETVLLGVIAEMLEAGDLALVPDAETPRGQRCVRLSFRRWMEKLSKARIAQQERA